MCIELISTISGHLHLATNIIMNHATPLFVALIVIEVMNVLFTVDSVPAILTITSDPFSVYCPNTMPF